MKGEYKTDENSNYVCYCGSKLNNNFKNIVAHNKTKKHLNYNADKALDTETYYSKHKERILARINTTEYKKHQKLYQQQYYKKHRTTRLMKIKKYNNSTERKSNNIYIHCQSCKCLFKKYNITKHKCCNNTLTKLNKINYARCLCGDVIQLTYQSQMLKHYKSINHKDKLQQLFKL